MKRLFLCYYGDMEGTNFPENEQKKEYILTPDQSRNIDEIFKNNPEYGQLWGSKEQYQHYLDTIFPDSKIKNVVFHQTSKSTKEFNGHEWNISYLGGAYFSFHNTKSGGLIKPVFQKIFPERTISAVLDIKNPYKINKKENSKKEIQSISSLRKKVDLTGYDSVIGYANVLYDKGELNDIDKLSEQDLTKSNNIEIVVLDSKQIHILCSDQDIQKAKEWLELNK